MGANLFVQCTPPLRCAWCVNFKRLLMHPQTVLTLKAKGTTCIQTPLHFCFFPLCHLIYIYIYIFSLAFLFCLLHSLHLAHSLSIPPFLLVPLSPFPFLSVYIALSLVLTGLCNATLLPSQPFDH